MSKLKDFSIATARMMPVILLADVSGSMSAYGKLTALNRAIAEMIATFADEQDLRAEIHVAAIAFGGDGIAAIRNGDGSLEILNGERQGFTNQTTGLGIARSTKDWTVITKSALSPDAAVLLATDGIADDLVSDHIGDFIHTLVTEFGAMAPLERRHALHRELRNWATPNHLDDKTLAILWRRQAEDEIR